eukprot:11462461-Prorocentrum_lima.AAC.1
MTSSLVGSEMCIRDRCLQEPWATVNSWQETDRAQFLPVVELRASNVGTVSYTHLTLPTICSV